MARAMVILAARKISRTKAGIGIIISASTPIRAIAMYISEFFLKLLSSRAWTEVAFAMAETYPCVLNN
jgi:hypothetical protein